MMKERALTLAADEGRGELEIAAARFVDEDDVVEGVGLRGTDVPRAIGQSLCEGR
jgi:hypothetical protein